MPRASEADRDTAARVALWRAIKRAERELFPGRGIGLAAEPPERHTWEFVEALSLMTILTKAQRVTSEVVSVFGGTGPIGFVEDGRECYLWSRPKVQSSQAEFWSEPDLAVTTTRALPTAGTMLRIIESKCRRQLGADAIRAEFGRAHDLRVTSYVVWSFYDPSQATKARATSYGIDLVALGFEPGTDSRRRFVSDPEELFYFVANTLEESARAQRFGLQLLAVADDAGRKMTVPQRGR